MLDPRNNNICVDSSSSSWQLTNRFSVTLTYVPKILSGIDTIDKSWGGMYQGGSYMCYGHASHGRGLLGMLFLQMGVLLEEKCLFFSPGKPQDWKIQAASVDFDLDKAQRDRRVRLVWIPAVAAQQGFSDAMASKAIEDLVQFIKSEAPDRVLINDFMPFLQFRSFDRFRQMFGWMMGQLSNGKTTTLLLMPDVINAQSRQIIEFMRNQLGWGTLPVRYSTPGRCPSSGHPGQRRCLRQKPRPARKGPPVHPSGQPFGPCLKAWPTAAPSRL